MSLYKRRRKVSPIPSVNAKEAVVIAEEVSDLPVETPHCTLKECIFCSKSFASLQEYGQEEEAIENTVNNRDLRFLRVLQFFQGKSDVLEVVKDDPCEFKSWHSEESNIYDQFTQYDSLRDAYGIVTRIPERVTTGRSCICETCTVCAISCMTPICHHYNQADTFACCSKLNEVNSILTPVTPCQGSSIHQYTPGVMAGELATLFRGTTAEYHLPSKNAVALRNRQSPLKWRAGLLQPQAHIHTSISYAMVTLVFLLHLFRGSMRLNNSLNKVHILTQVSRIHPIYVDIFLYLLQGVDVVYQPQKMPCTPVHAFTRFISPVAYAHQNSEIPVPRTTSQLHQCAQYIEYKQQRDTQMSVIGCIKYVIEDITSILSNCTDSAEYIAPLHRLAQYMTDNNAKAVELQCNHINTVHPFAVELNNEGKRAYFSASLASMVYRQFATDREWRCFYEIVQTGQKARFYSDIEYKTTTYRDIEKKLDMVIWRCISVAHRLLSQNSISSARETQATQIDSQVDIIDIHTLEHDSLVYTQLEQAEWSVCDYLHGKRDSVLDGIVENIEKYVSLQTQCTKAVYNAFVRDNIVSIPPPINQLHSGVASVRALQIVLFIILKQQQPTLLNEQQDVLFTPVFAAWLVRDQVSSDVKKFSRHLVLPLMHDAVFSRNLIIGGLIDHMHHLQSNQLPQYEDTQMYTCEKHKQVCDPSQYMLLTAEQNASWESFVGVHCVDIDLNTFLAATFPYLGSSIVVKDHKIMQKHELEGYFLKRSRVAGIYDRSVYSQNRCYRLPYGVKLSQPERVLHTSRSSIDAEREFLKQRVQRPEQSTKHHAQDILGKKRELLRDVLVIPTSDLMVIQSNVFCDHLVSQTCQDSPVVIGEDVGIVHIPVNISNMHVSVRTSAKRQFTRTSAVQDVPEWYFVHTIGKLPSGEFLDISKDCLPNDSANNDANNKLVSLFRRLDSTLITYSLYSNNTPGMSVTGQLPSSFLWTDCRIYRHILYQLCLHCQMHNISTERVPTPVCTSYTYDDSRNTIVYTYQHAVCWSNKRPHRSNGTLHTFDFTTRKYTQACYDRDCGNATVTDILME